MADLEMRTAEEALPAPGLSPDGEPRRGLPRHLSLLRHSPGAAVAAAVLLLWVVVAIVGPVLLGHAAAEQRLTERLTPPFHLNKGFMNILGTDTLGRGMLPRLVAGSRTALLVAGLAVALAATTGTAIGMVSGYFGRSWVDIALMRVADALMTCPSILLALTILYILTPNVGSLVVVLATTRLPVYMRLARARVLELREHAFVDVSRGLGSSRRRIIFTDLRPLVVPTIGTVAMLEVCTTLLNGAGLSFIGVGLQPPTIDWGLMVAEGKDYLANAWWLSVLPGLAIMLVTFSANILSNWLRSMADPAERSQILAARAWGRRPRVAPAAATSPPTGGDR